MIATSQHPALYTAPPLTSEDEQVLGAKIFSKVVKMAMLHAVTVPMIDQKARLLAFQCGMRSDQFGRQDVLIIGRARTRQLPVWHWTAHVGNQATRIEG